MNYLLDTHAFLWWLSDSDQLSEQARKIIGDSDNRIFMSHASQWEIAIKVSINRLTFPINDMETELVKNGFDLLNITTPHIIQTTSLPLHHRDPFDRMLIAQAQSESLILISKDHIFPRYDINLAW